MNVKPIVERLVGKYWVETTSANPLVSIELKSLNRQKYLRADRPGCEKNAVILSYLNCKCLMTWKIKNPNTPKRFVECTIFVNRSEVLSSELIQDGVNLIYQRWPATQLYVSLDVKRISSINGLSFRKAGWVSIGKNRYGHESLTYNSTS